MKREEEDEEDRFKNICEAYFMDVCLLVYS